MKQYLVTGLDSTNEGALEHRMSVRPAHFEMAKKLKEKGNFVLGGAILNDEEKMIGSSMVVQFETEADLQKWLDEEPYIQQKVWEKVDIKPYKVANV
ncbi:hypothetical protein TH63_03880 [Rufibacter radiotolerans]|uniref:YCII-related domain-containing protein n=1 Tax=Rufibacter radiotolerans TaxID=1379910 RepID=A0A0H4VNH0_9BACT|nr:YciI family protein [Rufibacter radiotolerans]AKQ47475.1 hypothetical protein TH63_03880 [Rufibacter radiotolerans]